MDAADVRKPEKKEEGDGATGALSSNQVQEMLQKQSVGVRADLTAFAQTAVAKAMAKTTMRMTRSRFQSIHVSRYASRLRAHIKRCRIS